MLSDDNNSGDGCQVILGVVMVIILEKVKIR